MQTHPRRKRTLALLLALALCLASLAPALAADTAKTVQLMKTEGTVTVTNASSRSVSVREKMRLYGGYHISTEKASYAWSSLDDTKLAKLDASSEMELRKSGSKVELLLKSGNLYFNVTEPLKEDETLNIRTSTTVMGIRGTCGWVNRVDATTTRVSLLHGKVECTVWNPVSGQQETVTVTAGQTATFLVHDPDLPGADCEVIFEQPAWETPLSVIPGFVQVELAGDPELCEKIQEAANIDLTGLTPDSAAASQAEDEAAQAEALDKIEEAVTNQDSNISTEPVWEETSSYYIETPTYTPATYTLTFDANGGSNAPEAVTTSTTFDLSKVDAPTAPAGTDYSFAGWALTEGARAKDVITTITPKADTELYAVWYTDIDSATASGDIYALNDALASGDVRIVAAAGAVADPTLSISGNVPLAVPSGSTLLVDSGVAVVNAGTVNVGSGGTMTVEGALTNGTDGTITVDGTLNALGTVENNGTIDVYSSNSFHASSITNSGMLVAYEGVLEGDSGGDTVSYGLIDVQGAVTNTGGIWIMGDSVLTYGTLDNTDGWMLDQSGALTVNSDAAMTSFASAREYIETIQNYVETATIGSTVSSIPGNAFSDCTALTSVTIPNNVTEIGMFAFYGCTNLESINIPGNVTSIGESTFEGCTKLATVTVSGIDDGSGEMMAPSLASIGAKAFSGCAALTNIVIPAAVTSIGENAFSGCDALTTIYFTGTVADWNNWAPHTNFPDKTVYVNGSTWTTSTSGIIEL